MIYDTAMITDEAVLKTLSELFTDLGGDPRRMPADRDDLYRAFEDLEAPPDVLALVSAWHGMLTNRELVPLIAMRRRIASR